MSVQIINKDNFEEIISGGKPVLVDFYADWCGPCRMLSPIVEEIASERDDIIVGKVNVDREEDLARRFNIYSIPSLIVFKDGEAVKQANGARPKASILSLIDG